MKNMKNTKRPLAEITPEYADQALFLHQCKYRKDKGQYVDPRTLKGAVELFGSFEALDEACKKVGL